DRAPQLSVAWRVTAELVIADLVEPIDRIERRSHVLEQLLVPRFWRRIEGRVEVLGGHLPGVDELLACLLLVVIVGVLLVSDLARVAILVDVQASVRDWRWADRSRERLLAVPKPLQHLCTGFDVAVL